MEDCLPSIDLMIPLIYEGDCVLDISPNWMLKSGAVQVVKQKFWNMFCAFAGKVRDFGKIGLSSQKEHEEKRSMCLNDFVKLFGWMPLVARHISVAQLRNWLF